MGTAKNVIESPSSGAFLYLIECLFFNRKVFVVILQDYCFNCRRRLNCKRFDWIRIDFLKSFCTVLPGRSMARAENSGFPDVLPNGVIAKF
jgi:hypothetical protein